MTAIDGRTRARVSSTLQKSPVDLRHKDWRRTVRGVVQAIVDEFVTLRCAPELHAAGIHVAADVLRDFVDGGKCVRSTFMYLGWLCGRPTERRRRAAGGRQPRAAACVRAAAGRRDGRRRHCVEAGPRATSRSPGGTAHVRLSGSPDRFGESAAVLLGDLCLVWAAQMMRESGVSATRPRPGLAPLRRDAHRAGGRTVRRSDQRCVRLSRPWTRCSTCRGANPATTPCGGPWRWARPWPAAVNTC